MTEEQIQAWQRSIQNYKNIYYGMYGKMPSEKLVESHCKINSIPWPVPRLEKEEETF